MNARRFFIIKSFTFMLTLLICLSGFQVMPVGTISGVIENTDNNSKSIVVNGMKVLISSDTKIVDEQGNILRIEDLSSNSTITIEGTHRPNGFSATKILLKTSKKGR